MGNGGAILRIASGAETATVGAVVRAPKDGTGQPTLLARGTSPIAVALDVHAVYWADLGGRIFRLGK